MQHDVGGTAETPDHQGVSQLVQQDRHEQGYHPDHQRDAARLATDSQEKAHQPEERMDAYGKA
jgi:hypothetical protein